MKTDFWGTLASWQDRRLLWLLGGGFALGTEFFSWFYFQNILRLDPCELCVYIRFSMVVIAFGGFWTALSPRRLFFKLSGYLMCFWGVVRGLLWNIALHREYLRAEADAYESACSLVKISFPFGLPLDQWLPAHFAPTALCGDDPWSLFGFNMAEWLFPVYAVFLAVLAVLALAWLTSPRRRGR